MRLELPDNRYEQDKNLGYHRSISIFLINTIQRFASQRRGRTNIGQDDGLLLTLHDPVFFGGKLSDVDTITLLKILHRSGLSHDDI